MWTFSFNIKQLAPKVLSKFNDNHNFNPVILSAHKLYTPLTPNENEIIDYVYVIELTPFDQGVSPEQKRRNIDQAALYATEITKNYYSLD